LVALQVPASRADNRAAPYRNCIIIFIFKKH
jgi:hypothetical protein